MESFRNMVTGVSYPFLDLLIKGILEHLRLFGLKELEPNFIAKTAELDLLMVIEVAPNPVSLICLCFDHFLLKIKPQLRELGDNFDQKDLLLKSILSCFESLEPYKQPIKSILRDLPFYPTFWKNLANYGLIWSNSFFRDLGLNFSMFQKINCLLLIRKLIKNWVVEHPKEFSESCGQAIRVLNFKQ